MELNSIDLNKLRTFTVIVDSAGVTAAATRLGLTRSAVSQSLAALEASFGVSLFHRIGRRLQLTSEGKALHGRVRECWDQLGEALAEVADDRRIVRGAVRVGLFLGFSRLRLARLIARFLAHHAGAGVRIRYASQGELAADLVGGRADLVVTLSPLRRAGIALDTRRLLQQELVLVGARRFRRGRWGADDLARVPVVDYYRSDPLVHRWLRHHFGTRRPRADVRVWAASTDLVLELVLAEAGLAVLPRDLAESHVRAGRLFVVDTGRPALTDTVWSSQLAARYPRPLLDAFSAAIEEAFPSARPPSR